MIIICVVYISSNKENEDSVSGKIYSFITTVTGMFPESNKPSNRVSDSSDKTTETITDAVTENETSGESSEKADSTESTTVLTTEADGLRADFKEAMDSYEAFMKEYCDFMEKYNADSSDVTLLADYASFMAKYADFAEKFSEWENEDLNDAELAYYIDVQARVEKMLLGVE